MKEDTKRKMGVIRVDLVTHDHSIELIAGLQLRIRLSCIVADMILRSRFGRTPTCDGQA